MKSAESVHAMGHNPLFLDKGVLLAAGVRFGAKTGFYSSSIYALLVSSFLTYAFSRSQYITSHDIVIYLLICLVFGMMAILFAMVIGACTGLLIARLIRICRSFVATGGALLIGSVFCAMISIIFYRVCLFFIPYESASYHLFIDIPCLIYVILGGQTAVKLYGYAATLPPHSVL